jgi:hypothetical protein
VATLAEGLFRLPQRLVGRDEMQRQVEDWEKPLDG